MTPPTISVVITTYNYGRFIQECIDSVLSQDYPAECREILVVDDGSIDDTPERVSKYGLKIKYLRQANAGQAAALNLAFGEATGEIVTLLDADDYLLPGKLVRVAEAFLRDPALGMFYHPLLTLHMDGTAAPTFFPDVSGYAGDDDAKLAKLLNLQTSCLAFRRTLVLKLRPIPEVLRVQGSDAYLVILAALAAPVCGTQEPLGVYRSHGSNWFYVEDPSVNPEAVARNLTRSIIALRELERWTLQNPEFHGGAKVRSFLRQNIVAFEGARFKAAPPRRLQFFWFLLRDNYVNQRRQSWKFSVCKYLVAPLALVFGYRRADLLYNLRDKTIDSVRSLLPAFLRRNQRAQERPE